MYFKWKTFEPSSYKNVIIDEANVLSPHVECQILSKKLAASKKSLFIGEVINIGC